MTRRIIAAGLTVAVLGLIVAVGARRPSSGSAGARGPSIDQAGTPEARLRAFIEDARDGDLDGYLDAYAEPLRARVARGADEAGRASFAEALRRASGARKSYALYVPEPDGPGAVRIVLESVYPDRNERQVYRLVQQPDGWRIAEVEAVRGRQPSARFGAPATYREPEGVPVQANEPNGTPEDPGPDIEEPSP